MFVYFPGEKQNAISNVERLIEETRELVNFYLSLFLRFNVKNPSQE